MGLYLLSGKCSQVSMSLTNFAEIPLDELYRTIQEEAARQGTSIAESELVGFVPQAAFEKAPEFFQRTRGFGESRLIENRLGGKRSGGGSEPGHPEPPILPYPARHNEQSR